jgi:two-component system response regulator FixJ
MTTGSVVHVIDDDDAARESLRFLLESAHLTVRAYPSAKEFLEALPDVEDGCIVTDVKMPDIDGLELIRHVKSHKTNLPVIAITGHGDVALAVDVMRAGAVNFIEKPYEDEVMLGAVRSALSVRAVDARLDGEKPEIRARLVALSPRERQVGWPGRRPPEQGHCA